MLYLFLGKWLIIVYRKSLFSIISGALSDLKCVTCAFRAKYNHTQANTSFQYGVANARYSC